MKQLIILTLTLFVFAPLCFAQEDSGGNHNGEVENLSLNLEYCGYSFINNLGQPVYFVSKTMSCKIYIKNSSQRVYKKLTVKTIQEYYNTGEVLPGASTAVFSDVILGPNEEIVLYVNYFITAAADPGLCQTHLVIKHWNQGNEDSAMILSLPQAGIYEVM